MGRFLDLLQQIFSEPDPEPIVEPDPEPIVEPDPEPIVESVVLNTFRSMTYKRKRK